MSVSRLGLLPILILVKTFYGHASRLHPIFPGVASPCPFLRWGSEYYGEVGRHGTTFDRQVWRIPKRQARIGYTFFSEYLTEPFVSTCFRVKSRKKQKSFLTDSTKYPNGTVRLFPVGLDRNCIRSDQPIEVSMMTTGMEPD